MVHEHKTIWLITVHFSFRSVTEEQVAISWFHLYKALKYQIPLLVIKTLNISLFFNHESKAHLNPNYIQASILQNTLPSNSHVAVSSSLHA